MAEFDYKLIICQYLCRQSTIPISIHFLRELLCY